MTPIADMVAQMLAGGVPHDAIVLAVRTAERAASGGRQVESRVDTAAEKRREWDRNYRRAKRPSQVESTRNPPEIHPTEKTPLILTSEEEDLKGRKKVRGRAAPIPPDWKPPHRSHDIARDLGLIVAEIEPRFRDYLASSGKLYADYDAGFCNFVRNTPKFNGGRNGHAHRPGSKEDNRERSAIAYRKLSEYVDSQADDTRAGGGPGEANAGLLPNPKPA